MKSLIQFIEESKNKKNDLNLKELKRLRALAKNYDHTKFKLDPKIAKHFEKTIKESEEIDPDKLFSDYETWVHDTIGGWIAATDGDPDEFDELKIDLMHAQEYFDKWIEDFYDEFGYDEKDNITYDYEHQLSEIVKKYAESAKRYITQLAEQM